jgi:hypothetical protein
MGAKRRQPRNKGKAQRSKLSFLNFINRTLISTKRESAGAAWEPLR